MFVHWMATELWNCSMKRNSVFVRYCGIASLFKYLLYGIYDLSLVQQTWPKTGLIKTAQWAGKTINHCSEIQNKKRLFDWNGKFMDCRKYYAMDERFFAVHALYRICFEFW